MANKTLNLRISHKIDTKENWETSELILLNGEVAYDETGAYKVGTGTKKWNELKYGGASTVHEAKVDPTTSDVDYDLGQVWLNTETDEFWIFADKETGLWHHMTHTSANDVTKQYVDEQLALKANTADVYTKTEVDNSLTLKANAADVYAKTELDPLLAKKADLVDGKIPAAQLPSYVDDVVEGTMNEDNTTFTPTDGTSNTQETGKIYVDTTTNKSYRWSGTVYVEISSSLALGETASTAFAGDRGKALEDKVTALETANEGLGALATKDTVASADIDNAAVTNEKIASVSLDKLENATGDTVIILNCGDSTAASA